MNLRRVRLWPLLVALLVCCAACASGGGSAGSTITDRSDPNLDPVKVGIIVGLGTPLMDHYSLPAALRAGVAGVNGRGGLNGHRVEVVVCNDKAEPSEAGRCARRMVDEKVVALVGGSSLHDAVIQPILAEAGIPIIGMNPFSGPTFNAENIYLPQVSSFQAYQGLLGFAVHNDMLPMAIATVDAPSGRAFSGFLEEELKKMTGGQGFVASVAVAPNTADYGPIVGTIVRAQPKSVLLILGAQPQQGFVRALEDRGSPVTAYLGHTTLPPKQARGLGPALDKMILGVRTPSLGHPSMARFNEELAVAAATGDEDAAPDRLDPYAAATWVSLQAVEQVAKGQTTITAASVKSALDQARDIDLGGVLPPWTPSRQGPKGFSRVSNDGLWFVGLARDGRDIPLTDSASTISDILAGTVTVRLPEAVR